MAPGRRSKGAASESFFLCLNMGIDIDSGAYRACNERIKALLACDPSSIIIALRTHS